MNTSAYRAVCVGFAGITLMLLAGKPEGKRTLGRPRRGWVDNIKMDLVEIGWGGVDWICVAQDGDKGTALMNAAMNIRVPRNAEKQHDWWPFEYLRAP
jgi:hypothetical protein